MPGDALVGTPRPFDPADLLMAGARFDVVLGEWGGAAMPDATGYPTAAGPPRSSLDPAGPGPPGPPTPLRWRSLGDGLLVSFLIAGPTLLAAFILRDQRLGGWIVLLPIAVAGVLVGGAIAGRHRRARRGAVRQGVVCGLLPATAIVLADGIRTSVLGQGLSTHTVALWVGVEVGSMVVAAIGALIGRRLLVRSRTRNLSRAA